MKYRLGIGVGLLMALLSFYPQFYFQFNRGENYQGATFHYDFDEAAYAAYLQSLIDGSPRKNSVYHNSNEVQTNENLFSIQFAAAYLIAIPSHLTGLSSDTSFLFISAIFAFLASLAIYWLILKITSNQSLACVGTLFILLFGANAAGAGILKETFGFGNSAFYLSFLRRYTPAVAFPFIFLLIGNVWLGLKTNRPKEKYLYALLTSLCFAFLVYSNFFYWTAVLVWLICHAALNWLIQKDDRSWKFWGIVLLGIMISLTPYFLLISNRSSTTDSSSILEHTRKIVWLRPTLILGIFTLLLTAFSIKLEWISLKNQITILIISLAVLPLLVFNQQIITGYSLQPFHYNMYILNYLNLLALVLLSGEVFKKNLSKTKPIIWVILAIVCYVWGIIEINYTIKYRYYYNLRRDQAVLINHHLAVLGKQNIAEAKSQITLNFDSVQGDNQPTVAPQGVLWAEHLFFFGNVSVEENRRRYFLYLYFQNKNVEWLRQNLQNCSNEACRALIGWRINPTLSFSLNRIDETEINSLIADYSDFTQNLTVSEALNPTISYVIVPNDMTTDFTNLDIWYQKEKSEQFGEYTLYKVTPIVR